MARHGTICLTILMAACGRVPHGAHTKDVVYQGGEEVFHLQDEELVHHSCQRTGVNRYAVNYSRDCVFDEVRVPFPVLQKELEIQFREFVPENDELFSFKHSTATSIRQLQLKSDALRKRIAALQESLAEAPAGAKEDIQEQLTDRKYELSRLTAKQENYETNLKIVNNLLDPSSVNTESLVDFLRSKLSRKETFFFDTELSLPSHEFAQADAASRKELILTLATGPVFRQAWLNVYMRAGASLDNPYNADVKKLRHDGSRRFVSGGKTFVLTADPSRDLARQTVLESVAVGADYKDTIDGRDEDSHVAQKTGLVPNIREFSCRSLFGGNARTATYDELALAADDIRKLPGFNQLAGRNIWAPYTIEGATRGWDWRGWRAWLASMQYASITERISFNADGSIGRRAELPLHALLICVL